MNPETQPYRYQVLKESLVKKIRSGEYGYGSRIDPELLLCKRFNLSRNTARQACLEYGACLKKSNMSEHPFTVPEDAAVAAELFAESRPDGVVCSTDEFAVVLCREMQKKGIRIPEQMLITGCNNTAVSETNIPPLTTLEIPTYELGAAARVLLAEITGQPAEIPHVFDPILIERDSTARM